MTSTGNKHIFLMLIEYFIFTEEDDRTLDGVCICTTEKPGDHRTRPALDIDAHRACDLVCIKRL